MARAGEGRTGPFIGRQDWRGPGAAEHGRRPTRGRSGRGGTLGVSGLRARSGLLGCLPGWGRDTWPSRGPKRRFCEWEGPRVELQGIAGESRALRGGGGGSGPVPGAGNSLAGVGLRRREIPAPRGTSGEAAEPARVGAGVSDPSGVQCASLPAPGPRQPCLVLWEEGSREGGMAQRSCGEEGAPTAP